MNDYAKSLQDKENETQSAGFSQSPDTEGFSSTWIDTHPEADAQGSLQDLADKSEQVIQLKGVDELANGSDLGYQETSMSSDIDDSSQQSGLLSDPDFVKTVLKKDSKNIEGEKKVDPKSEAYKSKINTLKEGGENMGEDSQIDLQGELTTSAKINRFFGKESTYSMLLKKVEEFNNAKSVIEKQVLLKELKPLARIWLEKHGESEPSKKQDENEQLKRESIIKFLDQTVSNYPEIIEEFENLHKRMETFIADPINNRDIFFRTVEDYKNLKSLVQTYKSTYPPSINLLFVAESEGIEAAELKLPKSNILKGADFDTGLGFSISNVEVHSELVSGTYWIEGNLELSLPGIISSKGKASVEFNAEGSYENITAIGESCKFVMDGLEFDMTGFSYNWSEETFTVDNVASSVIIFGNLIALTVNGFSLKKNEFDFESIEGELPDIDYGFFSLQKTKVVYSKESKAFTGKTSYKFNIKESPKGFDQFVTSGDLNIHYSPEGEKYYEIDNGQLKFNLLEQRAEIDRFKYSSKDQSINAENFNLNVELYEFNKSFTGKNVAITKDGLEYEKLIAGGSIHEFKVKMFKLSANEYSLSKDKDSGLKVNAHGNLTLNLPEQLGIDSEGKIEGDVGLRFDKSPPEFRISSGEAMVSMPNPLNKISEIFGDNWASSRYELSATIPVFPAVSAIFGLYIEYGTQFVEQISAIIKLDSANNTLSLETGTKISGVVDGGVFGGVQGGSQLLVALALLLRAAGKFGIESEFAYQKDFAIEKEPIETQIKNDPGFTYKISGDAKVGAYLDIVATALYFFRKQFSLTLGEKSLGVFEYSNTKESDPNMGDQALVDRAQLDGAIDPSLREEAKGLTIEQLLDWDYSHRFGADEKLEAIKVIKSAEAGRLEVNEQENRDPSKSQTFNNVALANLQFFNQFIDNRCNWDGIYEVLTAMGTSLESKENLQGMSDKGETYLKGTILNNIQKLGENSNIAEAFVNHYDEKVFDFKNAYPLEVISEYLSLLIQKSEVLHAVEKMKKDHLHSGFWGDKAKQEANIKISSLFGSSNYALFAADYIVFREVLMRNKSIFERVNTVGKEIAFKLVQDHQRKILNHE